MNVNKSLILFTLSFSLSLFSASEARPSGRARFASEPLLTRGLLTRSEQLPAVQQHCYWSVIHRLDLHHSLKSSRRNFIDCRFRLTHEEFIEWFSDFRRRCVDPRRPQSSSHIAIQSELRNYQQGAADILDGQIHLSFGVVKDA